MPGRWLYGTLHSVGYIEVVGARYVLPDGRVLLDDVNFRVGEGSKAALVGANGTGKTTLLRLIAGDLNAQAGSVARSGGLGVMRQFIGSVRDATTVREFLVGLAPAPVREAWAAVEAAELALMDHDDERRQLDYAHALTHWGDVGGYEAEVLWDTVVVAALGMPFDRGKYRDVPGKRWLEDRLRETAKTVLFVSHDRELLEQVADRIVTVEGATVWVHGGGFASYHEARSAKHERMAELRRRWEEEHVRLIELVRTLQQQAKVSDAMAAKYRVMVRRLERFEAAGPPPDKPTEQRVTMRLRGGRTGVRAVICEGLELVGLMRPFDLEIFYGERVGVLGANGAGKSHFLRLLAGEPVLASGAWRLGARVVPGRFAQTHVHPTWTARTLVDLLWHGEPGRDGVDRGRAIGALRRYGLQQQADQTFGSLSGGQQARFQILLLELSGTTLLLLDEPTDNLDVISA